MTIAATFGLVLCKIPMNILLLGSGGREHTFAWKLSQSPLLTKLFIAPGNAGTAHCGTNVNLAIDDFPVMEKFVLENKISMVVVGPEDPLVKGIHDYFLSKDSLRNIPVIGPQQDGAQLEGSKDFSKAFMVKYGVPTAKAQTFDKASLAEGLAFLETMKPPYVLKADGLAAGKGVVIPETLEEAKNELRAMLQDAKFGAASAKVLVEEFMKGIEISVFVLSDGYSYKLLPSAKDYKRIGEGDKGLNTGGMGAVSPVPFADSAFMKKVEDRIVVPTIEGLKKEGITYKGFIFVGLMNVDGEPMVIEYNCRMGDPETEVVIPRLENDLVEVFKAVAEGKLDTIELRLKPETATTVMLVAGGYPEAYEKGKVILGIDEVEDALVFHAGTKQKGEEVVTNGGRVMAITAFGKTIQEAVAKSLKGAQVVDYECKYYRSDIGKDLMNW